MVTIAVTSRNYAHTISEAIDSALAQRYPSLEVLILDNASTDGTAAVLARYAADPRVRIITHAEDIGMAANHTAAINEASGEYMLFLAADNRLSGGAIERAMTKLRRNPELDAVYSGIFLLTETGANLGGRPSELETAYTDARDEFAVMLAYGCDIQMEAMVTRTARFREAGIFDDRFVMIDYDMLLRLAGRGLRIAYDPQPFLFYRLHAQAQSSTSNLCATGRFYTEYLALLDMYVVPELVPRLHGYTEAIKRRINYTRHKVVDAGFVPPQAVVDKETEILERLDMLRAIGEQHRAAAAPNIALIIEGSRAPEDLEPLFASLDAQTRPPDEVVILVPNEYRAAYSGFNREARYAIRTVLFSYFRSRAEILNTGLVLTRADVFAFGNPGTHYRPEYFADVARTMHASDAGMLIDTALAKLPDSEFERAAIFSQAIPWIALSMLLVTRSAIDRALALNVDVPALGAWEWFIRLAHAVPVRFIDLAPLSQNVDAAAVHQHEFAVECGSVRDAVFSALRDMYTAVMPVDTPVDAARSSFLELAQGSTDIAATLAGIYCAWEVRAATAADERRYAESIHADVPGAASSVPHAVSQ